MPEDAQSSLSVIELLNEIEDPEFDSKSKTISLKTLLNILQNGKVPTQEEVLRILKCCTEKNITFLVYEVAIISVVVKNDEMTKSIDTDCLTASALFLLESLRNLSCAPYSMKLRTMTLNTFLSYPKPVLVKIYIDHGNQILDTINSDNECLDDGNKIEMCHLLKVLHYLPLLDAKVFVKQGLNTWLAKLIPQTMVYMTTENNNSNKLVYIKYLETLIEIIVTTDYSEHKQWKNFLKSICDSKKYPSIIKKLLEQQSDLWHQLWIIIIKLLNVHITKNVVGSGTPINSMLPVVEAAFKMDASQRIRAFQCWNILIDSFSKETNESCIAKRIKLLVIPLKLNNAKTEEIALAKFDTWWHFIRKFDCRSDRFLNDVLIPFLQFLFGKSGSPKSCCTVIQVSNKLKRKSLEALVEIVGHVNCDCSVEIPKLNSNVLNIKLLVSNWNDWMHFLENAFKLTGHAAIYDSSTKNYLKCILKTIVQLIAGLVDNSIRRDLFTEMLNLTLNILKEPQATEHLHDVVMNALMSALFDGTDQIKDLLKTKSEEYKPLSLITAAVVDPIMDKYYFRFTEPQLIHMFKPIAELVLREIVLNNKLGIFENLKPNDSLLKFWTAIMDCLSESSCDISPELLLSLMEWPLLKLDSFNEVKAAAMKWYLICNLMYKKLSTTGFNKEISKHIVPKADSMNYFLICVAIAVMKQRLLNGERPGAMSSLLKNITSSIKEYDEFEELIPLTVDTVVLIINTVVETEHIEFVNTATICVKNLLRVIITAIDIKSNKNDSTVTIFIHLNSLFKAINPLMEIASFRDYVLEIIEELSTLLTTVKRDSRLHNTLISVMKTWAVNETFKDKINNVINSPNRNNPSKQSSNNKMMEIAVVKEFTSPDIKKVKKSKKMEPNIVNKVVENGEEYVVVKSNWKFNPKKLTENQKEKLQRKREDIPALYQDLSQSQDEFKLGVWKTDSQDTSNTSSNSKTTNSKTVTIEDTPTILKTISNTDVVPKIIENILHKSDQKIEVPQNTDKEETLPEKGKKKAALTPTASNNKSPRLALKDRVFRNMKNLLEKSTPPKDKPDIDLKIHSEKVLGTPINKPKFDNTVLNTAPPMLVADRPSRSKRKPRKFDDTELFALKKRHSESGWSQSNSQNEVINNKSEKNSKAAENGNHDVNKIANDVMIEGVEPLNSNNEVVETPHIENISVSTNKVKSIDEVDHHKITEIDLTASIDDKGSSEAQMTEVVVIISDSQAFTEPKETTDTVVDENAETNTQIHTYEVENKTANLPVTPVSKNKDVVPKSSTRKRATKSRIEKELAIDMVEGHPLFKMQSEKRTRKKIMENVISGKRKSVIDKLDKSKSEATPKSTRKLKEKNGNTQISVTVEETQERSQFIKNVTHEEPPCSEDIIESSQDSSITSISVISNKRTTKLQPIVALEKINIPQLIKLKTTQDLLQDSEILLEQNKTESENRDDSVLPQNKTVEDNEQTVLTENMDTEPIGDNDITDDVIQPDDQEAPLTINSEVVIGPETQEIAEADTQTNSSMDFLLETSYAQMKDLIIQDNPVEGLLNRDSPLQGDSITDPDKTKELSPYNDENQRKQDFLNNTVEISPIKIQSPDRDKTPSPEKSSDFFVIKLSSPVHSNGEPFEKPGSPEFFTNDKISPDKRDISPPRTGAIVANNTSPSSSLSLKKNKPQVRPGGRAAHMLGLCVPDKLNTIKMTERFEVDEEKKVSTPARKNLRILYNTVGENLEPNESEDNENFLKLQRALPPVDCSPVGPILKRKLSEIADDATISPASKRKRVSFHDPPVSTTISVHKYIDPTGLRSPQNSAQKRSERQSRQPYSKSPKRLDNVFKLETVLSKAVESFAEVDISPLPVNTPEETQTSLEVTPAIEIINTSELNDTDPICPELVNCEDLISEIAAELSSPSLKHLFIKQVEDKVKTVGDLAKMTEEDICRLCIKAPKVQVAKKVLTEYVLKQTEIAQVEDVEPEIKPLVTEGLGLKVENNVNKSAVETQTDEVSRCDIEVQTNVIPLVVNSTQTDGPSVACTLVQTDESGSRTTSDVIKTCLTERTDFVEKLCEILDMTNIKKISDKLPATTIFDMLIQKRKSTDILDNVLNKECSDVSEEEKRKNELAYFTEYLSQRFGGKDLVLFCSQLLKKVHDNSL